jgi:outer membrane receptor for ferrienterochelin and colicins
MPANRMRVLFVMAMMALAMPARAQTASLSGTVTDPEGRGIPGAIVQVISGIRTVASSIADDTGHYSISGVQPGSYTIAARRVGYGQRKIDDVTIGAGGSGNLDIQLTVNPIQLNEVITAASRAPEKVIDAPASVSVIGAQEVEERAAVNITDHVAALPGIDVARGGLVRSNIVARGFNNIFSGALMTLTDHRFAFVPSLRVNIPYLSPTTNEDIDHIEVVLGPGAALYGPNTASGVMSVTTKSPFSSTGTTVTLDGGNQDLLRGGFRTAWVIAPKLAVKATYDVFKGTEWRFPKADSIGNPDDPSDDEKKPRDPDIRRQGGEVRVDYRPTAGSEIIANYGRAEAGSAVEPTGLGPAQVKNWVYQTYQLRARYSRLFAQVFMNTSDAGGTYLLQKVRPDTNCPDTSDQACIIDKSRQIAAQVQHGLNFGTRQRFVYGVDYIHTIPKTAGTINGRYESDDDITEVGGYLHSVTSLSPKFELTAAARVDDHSRLEDPVFSPRVALVFKPIENHNFRFTYNRAFGTPSTNSLFLDLVASQNALLKIRALGTPSTGFQFSRDCPSGVGGLCMKVFDAFGGSETAPFVPANPYATSVGAATAGGLAAALTASYTASGVPNAAQVAQGVVNFLNSLQPTAAQVGTTLLIPPVGGSAGFAVDPGSLVDIDRPKPTIHNVFEVGYKGIISNRLQISLDVWHEDRRNFVGPLQLETPLVFMNGQALGTYLAPQLAAFFQAAGFPAQNAAALAAGTATTLGSSLPGTNPLGNCATASSGCPIGVVNFDTPFAGNDVIVAYRSYARSLKLWGSDLGTELLLDGGFSLQGTYSWVNKGIFSKESLGTRDDVSLNAPRNKHTFTVRYRNESNGFGAELRERHVDGFNTLAFVGGPVDAYTLVDAGISFRPSFMNGALIAINGTNILNDVHREFTLGSEIGRLIITRLQLTF